MKLQIPRIIENNRYMLFFNCYNSILKDKIISKIRNEELTSKRLKIIKIFNIIKIMFF